MSGVLLVDRDGTIVHEPEDYQVDRLEKIRFVEGVIPALIQLQRAGFRLVMVSNQDGLGTDAFPQADFQKCHDYIMAVLTSQGIQFEQVLICPHKDDDHCQCRKPATGLMTDLLKDPSIDWQRSYVIGDRDSDVTLADNMQVGSFQLTTGGGEWTWPALADELLNAPRRASVTRKTSETDIRVTVNLDGEGRSSIATGLGFFDHMLEQLSRHSGVDINLAVTGDLHIDDHHTIEDTGLALGEAFKKALGSKRGIQRYGFTLPMDESRAECLLDLSGRFHAELDMPFTCEKIGEVATEMLPHFFSSFAAALGANLHLKVAGENNHHMAEASFKALARSLGQALRNDAGASLPTTKGVL